MESSANIYEHEIQFDKQYNKDSNIINNINLTENSLSKKDNPLQENNADLFSVKSTKNKFIKEYTTDINLYGLSIQNNSASFRIAASSLESTTENKIEIIEYFKDQDKLKRLTSENTLYPQSKISWSPKKENNSLLAASSDILRIYKFNELNSNLNLVCEFNKNQSSGPLTSMDWNKQNNNIIGVCSVDTTCTIWDLTKLDIKTKLIAHDGEVYDISFGNNENTFISTGADGSIRHFDLRNLDSCSVLFESQDQAPITRIAWNMIDNNYIAASLQDKSLIYIIDIRVSSTPLAELGYHTNLVNGIAWAPNSNSHICSVGDDKSVLIWDIQMITNRRSEPILCYKSENEIDNCAWSEPNDDWIAINSGNVMKILKVI